MRFTRIYLFRNDPSCSLTHVTCPLIRLHNTHTYIFDQIYSGRSAHPHFFFFMIMFRSIWLTVFRNNCLHTGSRAGSLYYTESLKPLKFQGKTEAEIFDLSDFFIPSGITAPPKTAPKLKIRGMTAGMRFAVSTSDQSMKHTSGNIYPGGYMGPAYQ